MKLNVGSADRVIRLIIGIALIGLLLTGTLQIGTTVGIIAAIAAAIMVITGTVSFCPAYSLIGVKTRKQ